ncbi:quinol:cytochrome c oxidoreductase quinone-binding subunit 2 [Flavobacterium aquidurense]|uniref:Quinol:cytochrome C oxidoreductase n=1 Tax=Flavobacterium frigidimaris TaxID=262320 RepID=A0ABX4BS24_FLAFR|nr:quinol:cytochrome C oxidoreductase [Flavobacterium frigidimaris]OXA80053.1 quinol:cytochrome C oxidoreductase [Flavobacterium frigidimaris]SDZ42532.1 quinol:cytochrome c oxidoreductase quinone-binding subunit 2 [Flavobacterium aquidurense]
MYTFSSKLKTFSIILMALGILGIGYGFLTAPKDIQEVEKILAADAHGSHGAAHEATTEASHQEAGHHEAAEASHESHNGGEHAKVDAADEHKEHLTHVLHQLQNKPWSALYVACIFFLLLSMGTLAFYAIQQVAQAGWSPVLFRVMQGITAYLPVGSIIFFIILILCGLHFNHLFVWLGEGVTDPSSANYDKIIAGKDGYLNFPFWIARAAVFLLGWNLYRYYSRKNCLAQDDANDDLYYKKNFKQTAGFLVFFIVSESIMSWDWIMSIDPHWFSTLFGWYVFASFFVSGITAIALVTVYLKSKGYLEYVNTSHIHDLAKFMFGISVFWTYLWFSQFMLIWYANIPEEVTYFITRIQLYNLPFFGAVVMNFVFPLLILINTDFKRLSWVIVMAGVVILLGHYVDFFNMIMPGTVGDKWFIGVPEIASILFFLGLFIFVVFTALTKAPLLAKRNPFIEESKHFHY